MNYSVIPSDRFKKEARRLIKKIPSLKVELVELSKTLSVNPKMGTSLGNDVYKMRVAIRSKGKGKSGGARVISYVVIENKEIYLLTIYDKSEFDTIEDKMIRKIIRELFDED